jgi:hypothetical protein
VSRKQTSQQSNCDHISRVKEWGFDDNHDFRATLWDCLLCGLESGKPFITLDEQVIDHSKCDYDPCFGCKAKGLQLNTGDAGRPIADKQWKANLKEYSDARKQGVQPQSTNVHAVRAAMEASTKLGKAYDANSMVRADKVTKRMASTMKQIGDI